MLTTSAWSFSGCVVHLIKLAFCDVVVQRIECQGMKVEVEDGRKVDINRRG